MHDIKQIKENQFDFEESMKKRNLRVNIDHLIDMHNSYLELLNEVQKYQEKKNILSKKVSTDSTLKDIEIKKISSEVKLLKNKLESLKSESEKKKKNLMNFLCNFLI